MMPRRSRNRPTRSRPSTRRFSRCRGLGSMCRRGPSRRDVLKAGVGAAAATVLASPLRAALPEASALTSALIEAAKKEGKVVFYTAMDLQFAQQLGKAFEAKFPGIGVRV